ncbi:MAG: class I SAM-dependent methyltransferase [Polyangiaceae bacterium]|nr:class I SAM-dependent methyltransferase [Polyangiaceae bacterium]
MLLNRFEKAMMNNPVRAGIQRHFEARTLTRLGGRAAGRRCLELGCGRGVGTEIILDHFGAASVDAFDLDPHMVALARRRLASRGTRVRVWQGSATDIAADSGSYGAVFDFGIVHHIPDWRRALAEAHRVLEPGGRLYLEEVLAKFILHPVWRRLLEHPLHDRFSGPQLTRALEDAGFVIRGSEELVGWFAFVVADKPR